MLTVTLALLVAGLAGVGALYLVGQHSAGQTRTAHVGTLQQTRADLAQKTRALADATADRDEGRTYYENETVRAQLDRACIDQVRAFLNELKRNVRAPAAFAQACAKVPARRSGSDQGSTSP